jgi:hypothetical protein
LIPDVASCRNARFTVGPPANTNDVVALLERHHVIRLRNLPRIHCHNSYAERAIGELKSRCGISGHQLSAGSLTEIHDPAQALECWTREFGQARVPLDRHTPRESRGRWTADELDAALQRGDTLVSRACFYARAGRAIANATENCGNGRARHSAECEAIYTTLETFGLITRTRGNSLFRAAICEGIS